MSIRVLLADDQAMVRAGFRMILESDPEIEVVGEAANGEQAMASTRRLGPDIVLMDIQMPDGDGLEATRRITEDGELHSRVVILTTFERDEYVFEALRSGASGFLLKNAPPEELLHAVHVVTAGEALLAPAVTRRIIEQFARRPAGPAARHAAGRLDGARARGADDAGAREEQRRAGRRAVRQPRARSRPTSPACSRSSGSVTAFRPSSSRTRAGWSRPARRRASVLRQRRERQRSALRRSADTPCGR